LTAGGRGVRVRRRSDWRLALAVVTLALAGAPVASASSNLLFGFTDNAPLSVGTKATAPALALGARGFAYFLLWAPGKSGLTQADTTGLARAIAASGGARVIVVLRTEGANTPLSDVAQQQFCNYARSAIRTFPTVNDVVIGNEANAPFFWRPQFKPDSSPASPAAYEALLARCYDVLHAERVGINVAAPGTSPHGNDNPNAVNNISNSPTRFIRGMAAAYRASGRTQRIFDTVVHHPYGDTNDERPYAMHPGPYFVGEGDWNKLVATYRDAFAGTAQAVPGRCLPPAPCVPIWYLEAGFQTSVRPGLYFGSENVIVVPDLGPVEPLSPSPLVMSSAPDQATQLRYALRLAYCQPYVEAVFNFLVKDDPNLLGYQSGILWADWRPKGSYAALAKVVADVQSGNVSCAAPSPPTSVSVQVLAGPPRVGLRWGASSSAIGVSGYRISRNGNVIATVPGLSYVDTEIAAVDGYTYTVRGFDAAGQTGDPSSNAVVSEATLAAVAARSTSGSGGCRPLKVRGRSFRISIVRGKVSCGVARGAIHAFISRQRSPKLWRCLRPRGHAKWAVACTKAKRGHVRVIVRAFRAR
jgi:hypothetical protein